MNARTAQQRRETAETQIELALNLDGTGATKIATGIGFFDHMLTLLGRHALIDLEISAKGDLHVDYHHTVEDCGIVLGSCLAEALGDKRGIVRYGSVYLPMDESLARVAIDLGGRPFLVFDGPQGAGAVGQFPFSLVEEFGRAFAFNAKLNLHAAILYGRDSHHMAEAFFKGLGRALREACAIDPREGGVPSTKGTIQ